MKPLLSAAAALLTLTAAAATAHAAPDVQAIDAWGRYVTSIDMHYKTVKKKMKWVPKGNFLFWVKNAESDDVVLAQYYQGRKKWGDELKCEVKTTPIKDSEWSFVSAYNCMLDLDEHGIMKAPRATKVVVGYRQLAAGEDHRELATYTFDVAPHEGAGDQREFHVDKDFRMGEAWLHMKQDGRSWNILAWFKQSNDRKTAIYRDGFKLRCTVGDARIEMNPLTNSRYDYEYDDYAIKDREDRKTQWSLQYFFPQGDGQQFFREHPGQYRCVLTRGGEVDRELHFEIGPDGKPVKPPCQQGETPLVRAPETTTLIKTVFKSPQDKAFDAKAFTKSAFYGRSGVPKACGF